MTNYGDHYRKHGMDLFEGSKQGLVSPEDFKGFCKLSALKYILRFEEKGTPIEDLEKARNFIDELILIQRDERQRD